MEEITKNTELEEESLEMVDQPSKMDNDELKQAIETQMSNIRRQSMLIGAQTACNVILQKIHAKPGKKTYRDYERLIKEIQTFCEIGISRKINPDGTTSPVENEASE